MLTAAAMAKIRTDQAAERLAKSTADLNRARESLGVEGPDSPGSSAGYFSSAQQRLEGAERETAIAQDEEERLREQVLATHEWLSEDRYDDLVAGLARQQKKDIERSENRRQKREGRLRNGKAAMAARDTLATVVGLKHSLANATASLSTNKPGADPGKVRSAKNKIRDAKAAAKKAKQLAWKAKRTAQYGSPEDAEKARKEAEEAAADAARLAQAAQDAADEMAKPGAGWSGPAESLPEDPPPPPGGPPAQAGQPDDQGDDGRDAGEPAGDGKCDRECKPGEVCECHWEPAEIPPLPPAAGADLGMIVYAPEATGGSGGGGGGPKAGLQIPFTPEDSTGIQYSQTAAEPGKPEPPGTALQPGDQARVPPKPAASAEEAKDGEPKPGEVKVQVSEGGEEKQLEALGLDELLALREFLAWRLEYELAVEPSTPAEDELRKNGIKQLHEDLVRVSRAIAARLDLALRNSSGDARSRSNAARLRREVARVRLNLKQASAESCIIWSNALSDLLTIANIPSQLSIDGRTARVDFEALLADFKSSVEHRGQAALMLTAERQLSDQIRPLRWLADNADQKHSAEATVDQLESRLARLGRRLKSHSRSAPRVKNLSDYMEFTPLRLETELPMRIPGILTVVGGDLGGSYDFGGFVRAPRRPAKREKRAPSVFDFAFGSEESLSPNWVFEVGRLPEWQADLAMAQGRVVATVDQVFGLGNEAGYLDTGGRPGLLGVALWGYDSLEYVVGESLARTSEGAYSLFRTINEGPSFRGLAQSASAADSGYDLQPGTREDIAYYGGFFGAGLLTAGMARWAVSVQGGGGESSLFWHGSKEAVLRREASGLFVDPPGAGGKYWATSRGSRTTATRLLIGGTKNVEFGGRPPYLRLVEKPFEATYGLSAEEAGLFHRAWGPSFSWNPYSWWKGTAGQYYLAPEGVTVGQRIGELGRAAVITGAGTVGGIGVSELTGE